MPALATGLPSSVKPSAPCSESSAISVSCSPCQPSGDRGEEADRDAGLARSRLAQRAEERRGVDDGVGVGHRDHAGVAARGGGARAGFEVLLVLLPGRAQVHVRVEEGRHRDQPAIAVDQLLALCGLQRPRLGELGDPPVAHEHVAPRVEALAGIEGADVAQEDVRGGPLPRRRAARACSCVPARSCAGRFGDSREAGVLRVGRFGALPACDPRLAGARPGARRGPPCARRRRPRPGR